MKKILVIGSPGSGKSYFSNILSKKLNIQVIHMDNLYWFKDKTFCSTEELLEKIKPILKEDNWIIDGNYNNSLELRLKYATDVYFLDLPRQECEKGIRERIGIPRNDIPWVETKEDAEELISMCKDFDTTTRIFEYDLIKSFENINIHIFHSRDEANEYLESI